VRRRVDHGGDAGHRKQHEGDASGRVKGGNKTSRSSSRREKGTSKTLLRRGRPRVLSAFSSGRRDCPEALIKEEKGQFGGKEPQTNHPVLRVEKGKITRMKKTRYDDFKKKMALSIPPGEKRERTAKPGR